MEAAVIDFITEVVVQCENGEMEKKERKEIINIGVRVRLFLPPAILMSLLLDWFQWCWIVLYRRNECLS